MAKTLRAEGIAARLNKLRIKPIENERLIKKWKRIERKFNGKN